MWAVTEGIEHELRPAPEVRTHVEEDEPTDRDSGHGPLEEVELAVPAWVVAEAACGEDEVLSDRNDRRRHTRVANGRPSRSEREPSEESHRPEGSCRLLGPRLHRRPTPCPQAGP